MKFCPLRGGCRLADSTVMFFINPDMSLQQRMESENMRILVKALHSVNPDLSVRGGIIVDFSARPRPSECNKTYHDKRESMTE